MRGRNGRSFDAMWRWRGAIERPMLTRPDRPLPPPCALLSRQQRKAITCMRAAAEVYQHVGNLTEGDAQDLLGFTVALPERLPSERYWGPTHAPEDALPGTTAACRGRARTR